MSDAEAVLNTERLEKAELWPCILMEHNCIWTIRSASTRGERITFRQIEGAKQAMTRYIKRGGKVWITNIPTHSSY